MVIQVILELKPGLSGIASIVFRNEEDILKNFDDPRPFYDSIIAPYKASLEVWYMKTKASLLYVNLVILTIILCI